MKKCFLLAGTFVMLGVHAQDAGRRLATVFAGFEKDAQLAHATASLYVADAKTGKVVFDRNGQTGLAPASTLKVITAATAFALLGKEYTYKTELALSADGKTLYLLPSGDPSFGSWRWSQTGEEGLVRKMVVALQDKDALPASMQLITEADGGPSIPDGWIWQDVGNYYGAGAGAFNWRENRFDLHLRSGAAVGSPVSISGTKPKLYGYALQAALRTGPKGSGDNAYIYFPLAGDSGVVRGTIPVDQERFVISGALPQPFGQFAGTLFDTLHRLGMAGAQTHWGRTAPGKAGAYNVVFTHTSPSLEQLAVPFLKNSINLYGEALLQTMGKGQEHPEDAVKDFWKAKGIAPAALHMVDGSGLSPANRVTTKAMVDILLFARKADWFDAFYRGFPEYNGMRIKSGTIGGVKGFCGYHTAADGSTYAFSFIVNNYNGSASALVQKMYAVLNVLK